MATCDDRGAMPDVYISSLQEMPRHVHATGASHLLSLVIPDDNPVTPPGVAPENHLFIGCHDIVEPYPGAVLPNAGHVRLIMDFAAAWDGSAPMLVHCFAGVSRSTAAALIVACVHERGREHQLARRLRAAAPHAQPNRRIIALGDAALRCGGALISAVESMGIGAWLDCAPLARLSLASRMSESPTALGCEE